MFYPRYICIVMVGFGKAKIASVYRVFICSLFAVSNFKGFCKVGKSIQSRSMYCRDNITWLSVFNISLLTSILQLLQRDAMRIISTIFRFVIFQQGFNSGNFWHIKYIVSSLVHIYNAQTKGIQHKSMGSQHMKGEYCASCSINSIESFYCAQIDTPGYALVFALVELWNISWMTGTFRITIDVTIKIVETSTQNTLFQCHSS